MSAVEPGHCTASLHGSSCSEIPHSFTWRACIRNMPSFHEVPCNKAVRQSPDLLFIATSFWFEESPSAVRTNKAGLGRLCTLFVCSTLLVFEHTHAVLSSTLVLCCTMVTTCTAAMSNSRYADTDRMKNVFLIRFSKAHLDRTKAGRMPADWKALPLHLSIRTLHVFIECYR